LKTLKGGGEFHMKDAVKRLKKDPWRAMTTATIADQKLPKLWPTHELRSHAKIALPRLPGLSQKFLACKKS
jgi:hypothetical protein